MTDVPVADGPRPISRPPVAVVDIDGVVADVRHRLHHIERTPRDWVGFFAGCADDPLLPEGRAVVDRCLRDGVAVRWLTGRPERLRTVTETWLAGHGLPSGPLDMRPDGRREPARVFKRARLRVLAATFDVRVVVDDDPAVVETLRRAGFPVLHAEWMARETWHGRDVLTTVQEDEGRT